MHRVLRQRWWPRRRAREAAAPWVRPAAAAVLWQSPPRGRGRRSQTGRRGGRTARMGDGVWFLWGRPVLWLLWVGLLSTASWVTVVWESTSSLTLADRGVGSGVNGGNWTGCWWRRGGSRGCRGWLCDGSGAGGVWVEALGPRVAEMGRRVAQLPAGVHRLSLHAPRAQHALGCSQVWLQMIRVDQSGVRGWW